MNRKIYANQTDTIDIGLLQVNVRSRTNNFPIEDAQVTISYSGDPDSPIEQVTTNSSGQTPAVEINTPPLELSLTTGQPQPYSECTISVEAPGYVPLLISGSEVLADTRAIQPAMMTPQETVLPTQSRNPIVIPPHTLYGSYPPKIAEAEIKPVEETGEIVLSRVVVPETVVVHDGPPTDSSATNYYIPYRDYIKNVASSEIYATWPDATIRANVLAIMSFTLNRVYTEWYRNRGYNFTITSSTAFDQKWIYGRNIYDTISQVVDEIFNSYLSRPDVKQPILTQYCDGRQVSCPNWMTQWGSKELGERGYSTIDILRNYYGSNMYINTAEQISGIPSSWPGTNLTIGSTGPKVQQLQEQLNAIANGYPAIPKVVEDGIYGSATANAVRTFQGIFDLPQTGVVDFATWYKISGIYVGVTRIAELS